MYNASLFGIVTMSPPPPTHPRTSASVPFQPPVASSCPPSPLKEPVGGDRARTPVASTEFQDLGQSYHSDIWPDSHRSWVRLLGQCGGGQGQDAWSTPGTKLPAGPHGPQPRLSLGGGGFHHTDRLPSLLEEPCPSPGPSHLGAGWLRHASSTQGTPPTPTH
jgi:hypothetical protein